MVENPETPVTNLVHELQERAKELNCLYQVEELFSRPGITMVQILEGIVAAIPHGWQFPDVCEARIVLDDAAVESQRFTETAWRLETPLVVQDETVGRIVVVYLEERPESAEGPFLKEERKLIDTIADRLERRIFHEKLRLVFEKEREREPAAGEWKIILDLLRRTDSKLLARITRKMLYHLAWSGSAEANRIIEEYSSEVRGQGDHTIDDNRPLAMKVHQSLFEMSDRIFSIATDSMPQADILVNIQKWIKEDRSSFLVRVLETAESSLAEIANAIERFHHLTPQGLELSLPRERAFRVSLIRRLLSDYPSFISIAKQFIDVNDFYELLRRVIHPAGSHGKLGGKAAGLFLASHILNRRAIGSDLIRAVKVPKTWYLTSDGILNFISSNDLEEIVEIKYEDIGRVRQEYPYIVNVFKNSPLPPEIINGLSVALDDFGDTPLIIRSSSLLEDRLGTSFAGKYKSLFIANQGTKHERLIALMDAITEVYASTFGPDPIEYRTQHNLIDFHEEMGVLIQEVAGTRIGHYFLPAFSGVAFSSNELRWSKRIRREDGLIRMVPGLGTRAVDRVSDDYPILIAPGQPALRVNVTTDEQVRYSPRLLDVINLKTNTLESVELRSLLHEFGNEYPMLHQLVSVLKDDRLELPSPVGIDTAHDMLVATFDGLITRTAFVEQIRSILEILQAEMQIPVDIEFAHDGKDLYLLQCRPQSHGPTSKAAHIPRDVPRDRIVFTANQYVPNGTIDGITHIVYVDPDRYDALQDRQQLLAVGRVVSRLNAILPKRQFILMGPGRWGSRGDIRLGVSVTYSDINNTAMLLEIARKMRGYVPELSFGTHFFQDLVEADIRYLPLYPDESTVVFNEALLTGSQNMLADLVPDAAWLGDTVRVIDVPRATGGLRLQVLMNGDEDEAMALVGDFHPEPPSAPSLASSAYDTRLRQDDAHWQWRLRAAEQMASSIEPGQYGVKAVYVFGSTKNATAGPESDIDLLIHFEGTNDNKRELMAWLDAWNASLGYMNYLRTGKRTAYLLDIHLITDDDIRNQSSWASKIGAVTDPARRIPLGSLTANPRE